MTYKKQKRQVVYLLWERFPGEVKETVGVLSDEAEAKRWASARVPDTAFVDMSGPSYGYDRVQVSSDLEDLKAIKTEEALEWKRVDDTRLIARGLPELE